MKTAPLEYQNPKDRAYTKTLFNAAPKEAMAFMNLKRTAERKDGAIPAKYRELISLAVTLTTQCGYCIESHIDNAVEAGATREEIAETVYIAAALRAGGAVGNGLLAMRLFEESSAANTSAVSDSGAKDHSAQVGAVDGHSVRST